MGILFQLKDNFKTVKWLRDQSGMGWDDETKTVVASEDVWKKIEEVSSFETNSPVCILCT